MVNPLNSGVSGLNQSAGVRAGMGASSPAESGGASFADALKKSVEEVSRLQQDASHAVESLATGKTDDVAGVMSAVEKSDLAFKTLLAIRAKLMDAYEEMKTMQV